MRPLRAFSLMEILIAVLILALGLLGLGAIFPAVVRAQRESVDTTLGVLAARGAEAYLKGIEPRRQQSFGGEVRRTARRFYFPQLTIYPVNNPRRYTDGDPETNPPWSQWDGSNAIDIPVAYSAWKAMIRPIQADVLGGQYPMETRRNVFETLPGPDGDLSGAERDTNSAPMYEIGFELGEWYVPPLDSTGAGIVIGDPDDDEAPRLTFTIPVAARLFPVVEDKNPQYVWDVAFQRVTENLRTDDIVNGYDPERDRYPDWAPIVDADYSIFPAPGKLRRHNPQVSVADGNAQAVEQGGDDHRVDPLPLPEAIRAAIFVRRIDPRVRVVDPDVTLAAAFTDRSLPPESQRVPVGEDADGEPTLDGTDGAGGLRYSMLRTVPVQFRYAPTANAPLERRRDLLFLGAGVTEQNFDFLAQANQKVVDNRGNVYTVVGSGGTGADRYIRVSPEVPASVTLTSAQNGVITQIVFSPQAPVAVIVTEVAR